MNPINFRNLSNPFMLAPMAEVSHCAFHKLILQFGGCGILFIEMLSAKSLPHETITESYHTRRINTTVPLFYQLLVSSAEQVAPAINALLPVSPDEIDINMGCPAPEILQMGGGIALRKDLKKVEHILKTVRSVWQGPLTVKTRIGWEMNMQDLRDFISCAEQCGADAVILHPRLKNEKLKRRARWDIVTEAKAFSPLPVIGNGDIASAKDAVEKYQKYKCDGIMIGRAAVQMPWIFLHIQEILQNKPCTEINLPKVWFDMVSNLKELLPEDKRLVSLIEFTVWYSKNFMYGHQFWKRVQNAKDFDDAVNEGKEFLR